MHYPLALLFTLPLLLPACGDDKSDATETSTGGDTDGFSSGSTPTGGEDDPELCAAACDHLFECGSKLAPTVAECVAACDDRGDPRRRPVSLSGTG